jgi:hypothetical protein
VFPVKYELNLCIIFRSNSVFKGLMRVERNAFVPYEISTPYILSNFCNNINMVAVP